MTLVLSSSPLCSTPVAEVSTLPSIDDVQGQARTDFAQQLAGRSASRRDVLSLAAGLVTTGFLSCGLIKPALAVPNTGAHRVYFRNNRTGESFNGVYRVGDKYLPEAFDQMTHLLRDTRNGETFPIDPRMIDIIYVVQKTLGTNEPYQVLSAYRSPRTNAMLAKVSYGVARHSLHMTGQAIDVRLDGESTGAIRKVATKLHAGGVGYYPKSGFVHLDSGNFRTW
jgi:uncharacterized protein YcbK (DUF882 family)